jgi:hypothetical protein
MSRGKGAVYDWDGKNPKGEAIRARAFVAIINGYGVVLLGVGLKDKVASRDADLRQIFATFGFTESRKDPRLVGQWLYEKNTWVGSYSSTTTRYLALHGDGTFSESGQFAASLQNTDGGGNDTGRTTGNSDSNESRGRWASGDGKLYLYFDDGSYAEYGCYVEDQGGGRSMLLQPGRGDKQLWTYRGQ